jgi:hypothetical protein
MKAKGYHIGPGTWWKTLAVFLLGFYFPASTLSAFPGLHNHSAPASFEADSSHDDAGHDSSMPREAGSHGDENCQICHIQTALGDSILLTGPIVHFTLSLESIPLPESAPGLPQFLIAEYQSRGPPLYAFA